MFNLCIYCKKIFRSSSTNYIGTELGNTVPVNCKMILKKETTEIQFQQFIE